MRSCLFRFSRLAAVLILAAVLGCAAPAGPAAPPAALAASGRVLRVGPDEALRRPSEAASAARDGDTVEIMPGSYAGDVAVWPQNGLVIRGVGGTPRIDAAGRAAEGKAIWVVRGDGVVIENVELLNCAVPDHNGAAIRAEGSDLTLRRVRLHGNQMGILTAEDFGGQLLIEQAEIHDNTVDHEATGALGHNIYVGRAARFVLRGSWVHGAVTGHNVKSRAAENRIVYNRIEDGGRGAASYQIDIAEAAPSVVVGNVIAKSRAAENHTLIAVAAERDERGPVLIHVGNNTLVHHGEDGVFLNNHGRSPVRLVNNILAGTGRPGVGLVEEQANVAVPLDAVTAEGMLRPASGMAERVRDRGVAVGPTEGVELAPLQSYVHPLQLAPRPVVGTAIDLGAHEIGG